MFSASVTAKLVDYKYWAAQRVRDSQCVLLQDTYNISTT